MHYYIFLLMFYWNSANALDVTTNYQYLWDYRDQDNNTETALTELVGLSIKDKNDYEVYWNLARFYYWAASETTNNEKGAELAKKGLEAAEKAKLIKPLGIEGWYWATANIGTYADAAGSFVRLLKI